MNFVHLLPVLSIFLANCLPVSAQSNSISPKTFQDSTTTYLELSGMGSSETRTAFWLQSNQFGTVPRTGSAGTFRGQFEQYWSLNKNRSKNNWRLGLGVETVANLAKKSEVILPQAYGAIRFKNWELVVGRRKQIVGLADSTLGTGSYIWSGNAMPIPSIQFGTSKFVTVPFTKGFIAFHGFYSEGLYEKNRATTSELKLHQKQLYFRLGKPDSKLKLYAGFNHQVQWGGKSPYETINGVMSRGWHNYVNLVTGQSGAMGIDTVSYFDNNNRVGNHLGTIDLAIELQNYENSWFIYRQSIYEDGTLYSLKNIADGLHGIRLRRKNFYGSNFSISTVVLEWLYTKSQGGPEFDYGNPNNKRGTLGRDNYFNNIQVRDGWSYYDRTIGTPFITPTTDTQWKYPNYADFFTSNNRVSVFHLGLMGSIFQKVDWTTKLSYSSNIGTYDAPLEADVRQFSGILGLQTKLRILGGSTLKGSIAIDNGDLYPNTVGFSLGLRKDFNL